MDKANTRHAMTNQYYQLMDEQKYDDAALLLQAIKRMDEDIKKEKEKTKGLATHETK